MQRLVWEPSRITLHNRVGANRSTLYDRDADSTCACHYIGNARVSMQTMYTPNEQHTHWLSCIPCPNTYDGQPFDLRHLAAARDPRRRQQPLNTQGRGWARQEGAPSKRSTLNKWTAVLQAPTNLPRTCRVRQMSRAVSARIRRSTMGNVHERAQHQGRAHHHRVAMRHSNIKWTAKAGKRKSDVGGIPAAGHPPRLAWCERSARAPRPGGKSI